MWRFKAPAWNLKRNRFILKVCPLLVPCAYPASSNYIHRLYSCSPIYCALYLSDWNDFAAKIALNLKTMGNHPQSYFQNAK